MSCDLLAGERREFLQWSEVSPCHACMGLSSRSPAESLSFGFVHPHQEAEVVGEHSPAQELYATSQSAFLCSSAVFKDRCPIPQILRAFPYAQPGSLLKNISAE